MSVPRERGSAPPPNFRIRDHYLGLATGVVTELNQIDQFFQAALQRPQDVTSGPEDSSLISLAERLSPNGKRADRAVEAR